MSSIASFLVITHIISPYFISHVQHSTCQFTNTQKKKKMKKIKINKTNTNMEKYIATTNTIQKRIPTIKLYEPNIIAHDTLRFVLRFTTLHAAFWVLFDFSQQFSNTMPVLLEDFGLLFYKDTELWQCRSSNVLLTP